MDDTVTRAIVPREWDDQNAVSPEHSNQHKKRPFPNLLFFLQNCGHRKAATDPRTQVQQWTIPLKEAASLLWYFYRDPLRSLTLLSLNVLSQKL